MRLGNWLSGWKVRRQGLKRGRKTGWRGQARRRKQQVPRVAAEVFEARLLLSGTTVDPADDTDLAQQIDAALTNAEAELATATADLESALADFETTLQAETATLDATLESLQTTHDTSVANAQQTADANLEAITQTLTATLD